MSLPTYRDYEDSGVAWIGHIPSHWKVDRIKASVSFARNGIWGEEPQGDENDIACVRVADFDRERLEVNPQIPTIRSVTAKERLNRLLNKGDLLLEKSGGGEQQPVGQVVRYQLDMPAVCSNFVARICLKQGMNTGYWNYVHSAAYSMGVNIGSINQTSGIQNLDQDRYFNERAPFPPEAEQVGIAAFLDRETAKIDTLIAEQEKLLTLLAEKRQATISHAVTKGLNPDVPMKDSGVGWLGEVPSHWTLTPLARLSLKRCDGPFGSGIKSEHYTDNGALVIRLQNIRAGLFNIGEPVFIDERYFLKELRGHEVRDGDLLVAGLGDDNNLLGRACIAPAGLGLALVKADCFRFRLDTERAEPEFVAWQLSSGAAYDAGVLATGTTRSRIPLSVMSSRQVALPPKDEQAVIAAFIVEENSKLDTLKIETQRAITLLKERRSGLISAAVTGQIDVRNAAP
ncbi:restriction endonuclease subunit S [Curvibacter lanceolatus]|uniref:restriction endonuclease subunit S n=1 Tax=Curvibacter lanceolatus TaxID=86182 RepID=UPI0003A56116|nr:restriction endonuclease subunit S [Curvibacter lanceolatus]